MLMPYLKWLMNSLKSRALRLPLDYSNTLFPHKNKITVQFPFLYNLDSSNISLTS